MVLAILIMSLIVSIISIIISIVSKHNTRHDKHKNTWFNTPKKNKKSWACQTCIKKPTVQSVL